MIPGVMRFSADEETFLAVAHHLRAGDAAKRPERGEKVNRLENICFPLRVVAQQKMESGRELEIEPRVIPKIPEPQLAEMHAKECFGMAGRSIQKKAWSPLESRDPGAKLVPDGGRKGLQRAGRKAKVPRSRIRGHLMIRAIFAALLLIMVTPAAVAAESGDLGRMQGKWEVSKTGDDGRKYKQSLEIKKDKVLFKILDNDGNVAFVATADLKLQKSGPFNTFTITNLKAGSSEDTLEAADEERSYVYQMGYETLTIVSNIDKEREQPPTVDIYKKVSGAK